MANVKHRLRFEQFLPHGRNHVSAAGQHADCLGLLAEQTDGFFYAARSQQFEFRETQSAPPSATVERRDGSSACRSGPLPLNHNDPPCSRKRTGDVGSTPSVRFSVFALFFARRAASTRSGVKGDSCKRTPTAL